MASEYDEDREHNERPESDVPESRDETDAPAEPAAEPVDESTEAGDAALAPVENQQNDAGTTVHEAVDPDAEDDPVDGDDDRGPNSDHKSDLPASGDDDLSTNAGDELPDQAPGARETPEEVAEDTTGDPEAELTEESAEPHESVHESTEPAQDVDAPTEPMYEPVDTMKEPVDETVEGSEPQPEATSESVEPIDESDEFTEPTRDVDEPVEPVDESPEAVGLPAESPAPVDSTDGPAEPVCDEPAPKWFPWEGLPTPERLPSAEFQAFLDERHAARKANLADPRHLTLLNGAGSEVPDPATEQQMRDPVTRPEVPDPVTDPDVPDPVTESQVPDSVTQPDGLDRGRAVAAQFSTGSDGDGGAARSSEREPVGAERHPEPEDEPVGADRHPEPEDEPAENDDQQQSRRDKVAGLVDAAAHEAAPVSIVQILDKLGLPLDDYIVKQLYEMAPAARVHAEYLLQQLLKRFG